MAFTAAELEKMRRVDEEIEADFRLTQEDLELGRELDRVAVWESKAPEARKLAAKKKAYYEANREKVAAQQKAYYEANRERYNSYMREYRARRRRQTDERTTAEAEPF